MFEPFCGLSGHPFELRPDPAFFFRSRGHKRAYACLRRGLYQAGGITVLTGEVGAGKTTTIEFFRRQLDATRVIARKLDCGQLNARGLLPAVANAFGVEDGSLRSLAASSKRVLLILDEAQTLPLESLRDLRLLCDLESGSRPLLQSFVVGRPELRRVLTNASMQTFRQRVNASYHLGPLDGHETRGYIEHRLKQVGWNGDPRFDEDAFAVIHSHTGGIPRHINVLCAQALTGVFVAEKSLVGAEALRRAIQAV